MRSRCLSEDNPAYSRYGGRGIGICAEWEDFSVFRAWATSSGWQEELTLDRIDNEGPYSPGNCRWATRSVQGRNRRNNVRLQWDSETKSLVEWSEDPRCMVSYSTLYSRIRQGWATQDAVTTPPGTRRGGDATNVY